MYYLYVLRSDRDNNFYIGYTGDLEERLKLHNEGRVKSTKDRRPFKIIYYEACLNQKDALQREKYLKTNYCKRFIKSRIKEYLNKK